MKKLAAAFLFVTLLMSACVQTNEPEKPAVSVGSETQEPVTDQLDIAGILEGIDVNELCQMTIGAALDVLPEGYEGPFMDSYSYPPALFMINGEIKYGEICAISFSKEVESAEELKKLEYDPESAITGITIYQEFDVYKGISVGKTLDEMNGNAELLNKLLEPDSSLSENMSAYCYYLHDGVPVRMALGLDADFRCTEIKITSLRDLML